MTRNECHILREELKQANKIADYLDEKYDKLFDYFNEKYPTEMGVYLTKEKIDDNNSQTTEGK